MIYLLHNTLDHIMIHTVTDNVMLQREWNDPVSQIYLAHILAKMQKWILFRVAHFLAGKGETGNGYREIDQNLTNLAR